MAPITDQMVDELKGTISKLEARVQELEGKLQQKVSGSSTSESMRMILIGPPGAGKFSDTDKIFWKAPSGAL